MNQIYQQMNQFMPFIPNTPIGLVNHSSSSSSQLMSSNFQLMETESNYFRQPAPRNSQNQNQTVHIHSSLKSKRKRDDQDDDEWDE